MRSLAAMLLMMFPLAAAAQQEPPAVQRPSLRITGDYVGLTAEDRTSYCFWAGQLYSIGASFCSRQQTLTTCTEVTGRRPAWTSKENDKFCDRNPSLTPQ
jgi:hypothetical protein